MKATVYLSFFRSALKVTPQMNDPWLQAISSVHFFQFSLAAA